MSVLLPVYFYLLLTTHYSLLITHYSLLTTYYSLLTTHYSLLTTCYSLLTTHYSLLVTHYSLLTTHYLLLITHYSLLTTHYFNNVSPSPPSLKRKSSPQRSGINRSVSILIGGVFNYLQCGCNLHVAANWIVVKCFVICLG